jgi:glucose/mannose-6-phosphate isomerase
MMVNLDDKSIYTSLDKSGMGAQIRGLPEQCRLAWEKALTFKLPPGYSDVNKVVILGMGGSAIGGDLLRGMAGNACRAVMLVQREYDLPGWVDEKTLVIASSYSGNTEETLSSFAQALKKDCRKLAIATGGKLADMAREAGVPLFVIDHVAPPRAALGASLLPLLAIAGSLGLLSLKKDEVGAALASLEKLGAGWQEDSPVERNRAKQLALKSQGKIAVVYGAGLLTDVARRWKTQINENSKAWAFFETLPELNHNAVLGYSYPAELAGSFYVLMLRCRSLHPRTLIRYTVTGELLSKAGIPYEYIDSAGNSPLEDMLGLVLLGDWVSYYLAMLYGADPSPVPQIDFLKKRLAESQ